MVGKTGAFYAMRLCLASIISEEKKRRVKGMLAALECQTFSANAGSPASNF
jgi:hypothetical protein